ncbi:MAG: DUF460 domain-containing protein [Candidatus Aenigmarchaeota archaeon]|nr:DUF460 domain-containing protein [Candidatus Aenigmarchaeota archaeon]
MTERRLLIGGIDVGLHTSLALLDLDGNMVSLSTMYSGHGSDILKIITEKGNVAVIATDRAKPPSGVKKIASSISAKLVLPSRNMTNKKKRIMIKDFTEDKVRLNSHEKASLASAIFAYKKFRPGFKKLRERMEKGGTPERYEEMRDSLFLSIIGNRKDY